MPATPRSPWPSTAPASSPAPRSSPGRANAPPSARAACPARKSAKPTPEPPTAEATGAPHAPAPVEPGLSLQAEPILGPDGSTIDLSIDLKFGLRVAPGDVAPITGGLNTTLTVRSGRSVLQRLSLEGAPWPEIALVLSATIKLADVDGWKNGVLQLLPREQEWRALGTRTPEGAGK